MIQIFIKLFTTDNLEFITNLVESKTLGGKRFMYNTITVKERLLWCIPIKFSHVKRVYMIPYKENVAKDLYNYRDLGKNSNPLTNIVMELKGTNVNVPLTQIKLEEVIKINSTFYNKIIKKLKSC